MSVSEFDRRLTATEAGNLLGLSRNYVGKLANRGVFQRMEGRYPFR